ncbi:MAG TPA: hypothetical protein QGF58_21585 [Myxococcota bacterium]|nr:hypothetical protein [Myxococcota bacterium]
MVLFTSIALANPDSAALQKCWADQLPTLQDHGTLPQPELSEDQWALVATGQVARWRQQVDDEVDGAVGVGYLAYPMEQVWVGALDDVHDHLVDGLTEVWLLGTVPGYKVLYQHYDVPAPFSDRHWVVVVQNNPPLHAASEGVVWERIWDLDERATGALADVPEDTVPEPEKALWTPVNQGGWILMSCGEGVLVVYQVRTDIGGNIPEELVVRFAMAGLDSMIDHLGELAEGVPEHYVGEHFDIVRPDGTSIPTYESP